MKTYNLLFGGSFWLRFGDFRLEKNTPEAKTAKTLILMTLTSENHDFGGPEGSKMRSKCDNNCKKEAARTDKIKKVVSRWPRAPQENDLKILMTYFSPGGGG
mgnify:CR=1 FL=1